MCKSKRTRGIGFRDYECFNQTFVAKSITSRALKRTKPSKNHFLRIWTKKCANQSPQPSKPVKQFTGPTLVLSTCTSEGWEADLYFLAGLNIQPNCHEVGAGLAGIQRNPPSSNSGQLSLGSWRRRVLAHIHTRARCCFCLSFARTCCC
jgi:hypothetical protein